MRVDGVGVAAEDVRGAAAHVLGVGGVLEREQAEETLLGLLVEVVAAVSNSKQVAIFVTPLKICHLKTMSLNMTCFLDGVP